MVVLTSESADFIGQTGGVQSDVPHHHISDPPHKPGGLERGIGGQGEDVDPSQVEGAAMIRELLCGSSGVDTPAKEVRHKTLCQGSLRQANGPPEDTRKYAMHSRYVKT